MTTPERITSLEPNEIFVFGSNLAGRHGKGAAKDAVGFGARYGVWYGLSGQTWAIPTKDQYLEALPIWEIRKHVMMSLDWFRNNPQLTFLVTPIGCGLAGYEPKDIATMFSGAPTNVVLPKPFQRVLYPQMYGADLD